jgi:uncharacterized protein
MTNPSNTGRHPLHSILLIIIFVGVGFLLIGPGIGLLVASAFYEGDLLTALQSNPDQTLFIPLMITQGFASLIGLILIPVLYIILVERKPVAPYFRFHDPWGIVIPLLIFIGIGFQVVLSPVVEWNMHFQFPEFLQEFGRWAREREDALAEMTRLLTNFQTTENFVLGFVVIALLPGIGEELVFRGLIQRELYRGSGNLHLSVWAAAFIFSAIHMQFFGFVPRMMLGALFGYLYHWSGNLIVPMFAHFFHNGFTVVMLYLHQQGLIAVDIESEEAAPWPWVSVSVVATLALLYYFRKLYISIPPAPRDESSIEIQ